MQTEATLHLLEKGIIPDEAVGDFDSVSKEEYEVIRLILSESLVGFAQKKMKRIPNLLFGAPFTYKPEQVVLTGVTGGRFDHTESALHLLYRLQIENPAISFSIRNSANELSMLLPTVHELTRNKRYPFVSFFPFGGKVTGLTL